MAHISSEVQSIKSIEEELYNIRKDVNDLKCINNPNNAVNSNVRSLSEPNFLNNNNNNIGSNYLYNNHPTTPATTPTSTLIHHQTSQDIFNQKDKMRLLVPSFTNPRRLRKLTKFVSKLVFFF